ncbi:MAG: ARMT1-like domain-containing protein [Desulfobacterales bacterium]
MKTLQPIPQCIDCLMSLAKDAAALADPADSGLIAEAESISRNVLAEAAHNEWSSPQIANRILRELRQITGIADPYQDFKAREMDQARKVFSQLQDRVGRDLKSRVKFAVLGNSLDFFNNPVQALADIPHQFSNGIAFYRDDLAQLEQLLANNPQRILYLTDNAGEIYFDIPLYDYLKHHCRQIYLVVKGGPSLNDLTRTELHSAELTGRFDAVADTGTDGAGIDWDHVSAEFLDLVASADLVVSKGMANFETMYPKSIAAPSFYLFKVKCKPIQNFIEAPVSSFMALLKPEISER